MKLVAFEISVIKHIEEAYIRRSLRRSHSCALVGQHHICRLLKTSEHSFRYYIYANKTSIGFRFVLFIHPMLDCALQNKDIYFTCY